MKVRILGMVLLFVGFFAISIFDHDMIDIFSGILIGAGLGFILTGRLKNRKIFS